MKNAKRWLAVILAVTLLGSNAVYQLGTTLSANETEAVTESQQDESENAVAEQAEKQQEDTGKATVQEVTPQEDKPDASAQEASNEQAQQSQPAQAEANTQEAAPANAGQSEPEANQVSDGNAAQAETPVAQTYDVKINKPELDGGQIKVWGTDGIQTDVTSYDGNNQYVKEVTEGEDFNFQITRNDGFEIENVTVNGVQVAPESTDGSVSTYKLSGVAEEKAITITYNKVETQTEEKNGEDGKTEDANQDESPIAVQAAQGYIWIYGKDTVYIDRSITLSAVLSGAEGTVEWSSSDPSVATVDQNGKVTGIKKGTVTIYAALGTALIASKQITVKRDESNGQYVYLYTKVTGDTTGLVLNKDGWYTIGKLWVANMPSAANSRYPNGKYYNSGTEWNAVQSALANPNNFERYGSNTTIEMSSINWSNYGLIIAAGATNYVGSGRQWHLDGLSNVTSYGSVTINHYLEGTTQKLADSQTINAEENTVINGANYKKTITGYSYTSANPAQYTIVKKTTGEINLYYSKGSFAYTVNYLDKETKESIHPEKTGFGDFGQKITENAIDIPGYNKVDPTSQNITIKVKDNVINFYYEKKNDLSYTVQYLEEGTNKVLHDPVTKDNVTMKTVVNAVDEKVDIPGYHYVSADPEQLTVGANASDNVIKIYYKADTNTAYRVEHYLQNLTGDGYDLADTEELTGTTGKEVTAKAKSYTGFTFDDSVEGTVKSGTIAGNGSLVLKLYYTRNSYKVTYAYTGTIPEGASTLPAEATYKYGATVSIADGATAPGYTFSGWSRTEDFTMPHADVTITGSFTANGNTEYTVEHYLEDLDGKGYTLKDTETQNGETGTSVTANPKTYEGFTVDYSVEGTKKEGKIKGDGSLVLKLYYTRNSYKVTYTYEGTVPAGASKVPAEKAYKYGADVTVAAKATAPAGYTFNGWTTADATVKDGKFTMPEGNVVLKGNFTANTNTKYQVKHYLEKLGGTYELEDTEELTGTTDSNVTASEKAYTGFMLDPTVEGTKLSGKVKGDGSLVLKLYYTRNSYEVTYEYTGTVPTGASGLPSTVSYKYGANVTVAAKASAPAGYTFHGWSTENATVKDGAFEMPDHAVTLKGNFTANENTQYTIEYYQENLDGKGYTKVESKNKIGTTGTEGTVEATDEKTYPGFTLDKNIDGTILSGTIAGDGSLVLRLYYARNSYQVTYEYTGTIPEGASELPAAASYKYGADVTVAKKATAPGYTFVGWSKSGTFQMPADNVKITGKFAANTNTAYKVEHYWQNLDNDEYTLHETETLAGTTGETAEAKAKSYTGFTFDDSVEGTVKSGTIAGNGSLVLKLYYTRNSYKVTYAYTGTIPEGASTLPAEATYKYGATVSIADGATAPGYTFSGWSRTEDFTMPHADVTITGSFTANGNTEYTVEHYLEDLDGKGYTLKDTETQNGETGTSVTANPKTYEGFTVDYSVEGTKKEGKIKGDGSLVLKLYYTRNSYKVTYTYEGTIPTGASKVPAEKSYKYGEKVTVEDQATAPAGYTFEGWTPEKVTVKDGKFTMPAESVVLKGKFTANEDTKYQVKHYLEKLDGTYELKDTEEKKGTTDTEATAKSKTYEGFTFDAKVKGTKQSGTITGDGKLVLKLYYTRNSYKVTYDYTGDVPTRASALPAEATYKYGADVTVADKATAPGYTFEGWTPEKVTVKDGKFTMPADNVKITGKFAANTNTAYKVEYYWQNLDNDEYTLHETETLAGTTGKTATAEAKTYDGFTLNEAAAGTVKSGTIAGDGSLVLKLYYTRNSYKVTYAYTGDIPEGASELPAVASYKYGADVTVAGAATAPGYTFSGWSKSGTFQMPADNVKITGKFVANTNTEYKVEHYWQNVDDDNYTLHETETLAGTTGETATAEEKTYDGFTLNEEVAGTVKSGTIAGDGSLVLRLYYTRNAYKVTYAYTGMTPEGASALPAEATYKYGAPVSIAEAATAPGYTFSGWSRTDDFTMPNEDVTITGSFTANGDTEYKVEHYLQNPDGKGYTLADTEAPLTGETGTTATANPKTYEGFTFDSSVEGTVQSGTIAGDGSLVLKLYYTRNSYDVTYEYTGTVPAGASKVPAKASYKYGATVNIAEAATAPGYTFSGWSRTEDFEMPAENVTITGSFKANTNTKYQIEHYLEKLDGTYELKDTENLKGTTDAEVTAKAKTYEGFTFDAKVKGTKRSGTITGDGKLVLKLYYTRNSYKVSYEYTGTVPTGASALPEEATYKYEENVTVAAKATAPVGYTFEGWDKEGSFTMPSEDVTIRGTFKANTDTAYKVEYYYQNEKTGKYELEGTAKERYGTTDQTVEVTDLDKTPVKDLEHYVFDSNVTGTKLSGTVAGDGSLVLKVYFSLQYSVTGTIDNEGTVTNANQTVAYAKSSQEMVFAAQPGYIIKTITVNGKKQDVSKDQNTYTYPVNEAVKEDITVEVKTEKAAPHLTVTKTTTSKPKNGSTYALGEKITYQITVKNDGNVSVKNITVSDPLLDKEWTVTELAPNETSEAFTGEYVVTEQDILNGSVVNNATATGESIDPDIPEPEVTPGETTDETEKPNGHITVAKKTTSTPENGNTYVLGETITYKITAKNDGNLTLTDVMVIDELTGLRETIEGNFEPGAERTFTTSHVVTTDDIQNGKVTNVATAEGTSPDPDKPTPDVTPGTAEDPVDEPNPSLAVVKTSDTEGQVTLGQKITYTITVTNNGNTVIDNINLTDDKTRESWSDVGTLQPGEQAVRTTEYTVTEADIIEGQIVNHATATGKDPSGNDVTGKGDKTVETEPSNPHITVTKETTSTPKNGETYALGEEITYKITAKNTGNLTLTDVTVSDELTGNTGDKAFKIDGEFKPGDEKTFETSYTVTEADLGKTVVNVATATGKTPDPDKPKPDVDPGKKEDPTDQKKPSMSIEKKVIDQKEKYEIGDIVKYEITVTNTGNTTQKNILVEDQMNAAGQAVITKVDGANGTIDGAKVTLDTLAPGKAATITAEYTVVKADRGKTITNAAVAKGEGEIPKTPDVPVKVEEVYDIHVVHAFAPGNEGDVTLPADYTIENLKPGTVKSLMAKGVTGYVAYPAVQNATVVDRDITVTFLYYKDKIGTDPTNPDKPDGVPDEFQAVVRFAAVNGTVSIDHAVVTLLGEDGKPAKNGVGHLSALQIAAATANAGYDQASLSWAPQAPTMDYNITGDMTFTATFTATPVTPPATPDNPRPNNPTRPSGQTTEPTGNAFVDNVVTPVVETVKEKAAKIQEVFNSDDEDVPLADQNLDNHKCCILHFLIMLITLLVYALATKSMKKRQKKLHEVREELDCELARRGLPLSREKE